MNTDAIKIKYGDNQWLQGDDFVDDGFTLTESICSESQIVFGACESAAVEVSIISTAASFVGQTLEAYLGNDLLGKYKVVSDERASDGETRTLKAYDALYDIIGKDVAEWYSGINWDTVTNLKQFRDSFFSYLGIPQVQTTLPNDSMAVSKTMEMSSCSGATIINAICEINGGFGHINPNGYFQYVFLTGSETPISISADEVFDTITEEFTVPSFDSVLIRTEEGDIGGQYPASGGENQYIITGNFLCYGKTSAQLQAIAQNASGRIFGKSYIPFEAEVECQNSVELGNKVTIAADPVAITSYVLQRRLAGVSGLEEYFAAQGTAEYVEDVNSTRNQMVATAQRINKLTVTLDGTTSRVQTIENNYVTSTTLEETEKGFTAKVEEIDNELQQITDQLDGKVTSYNISGTPVFRKNEDNTLAEANYPAITFTYNIYVHPAEAVQIGPEGVPFLYKDEYLQKHTRDLVTDTDTYHAYRFIKDSGIYDWKQIEDSDFGIAMSRISSLEATSESIKQTVTAQGVSITNQGARITTAEGTLVTQSDEIAAKVSVEGGTASTNASWSLKPDAFIVKSNGQEVLKVNGSGLSVNGSGTFSGEVSGGSININNNFIVDSSGNVTAKSGTFSGDITGAKMTIGGVEQGLNNAVTTITNSTLQTTNVEAQNLVVQAAKINGTLSVDQIDVANLHVGGGNAKGQIKLDSDAVISWDNISNAVTGQQYAKSSDVPTTDAITKITKDTITTDYLVTNKIKTYDFSAETVSGKKLSGNTINNGNGTFIVDTNGAMSASNATINGGSISIKNGNIETFKVTNTGHLKATDAEIEGTIKSSNAIITGGSIKIETDDSSYNLIDLKAEDETGKFESIIFTGGTKYEYSNEAWTSFVEIEPMQTGLLVYSQVSGEIQKAVQIYQGKISTSDGDVLTEADTEWNLVQGSQFGTKKTFNCGTYKTMLIEGVANGTSPIQTITVPLFTLSTTAKKYSIFYSGYYLNLSITKYQSSVSITCESNSSGYVKAIYLQK